MQDHVIQVAVAGASGLERQHKYDAGATFVLYALTTSGPTSNRSLQKPR